MSSIDSKEIRRFFDLLGSVFCGLVISFIFWTEFFRFSHSRENKFLFLPIFLLLGISIYTFFYKLIWKFFKAKFFYGHFNFILISVLSISIVFLCGLSINYLFHGLPVFSTDFRVSAKQYIFNLILFYYYTLLPMAVFWFIGVLCSWKFAKRDILP